MKLQLTLVRRNRKEMNTDELEQPVDTSSSSSLNPDVPKETDPLTQDGTHMRKRFLSFLSLVRPVIVDEARNSNLMKINRTESFDPSKFMERWGLEIVEHDERSMAFEEINLSEIFLQSMSAGEAVIRGKERLKRLKEAGCICLDAMVFQTLWENQRLIPENWKGTADNPKRIFFDGTVLKNQFGRYVITLYWDNDYKWHWTCRLLDAGGWNANDWSVVLKGGVGSEDRQGISKD
jgi:hypothetical protein